MAQALVLERARELTLRDIPLHRPMGDDDVRVKMHVVGICGRDVHYYKHGRIGPFVVEAPMVLGHEGAGTVVEVGRNVRSLSVGERVAVEPGIPDFSSRASRIGLYNLDPTPTFWATPPVHGCLTPEVVHPAALTYRLPDTVSLEEGAMVEPLAVGVQAVAKAGVMLGDTALVLGAGPIGILVALAARANGCARVLIHDPVDERFDAAAAFGLSPVYGRDGPVAAQVSGATDDWGVDLVFECSGAAAAFAEAPSALRPGGRLVCAPGCPSTRCRSISSASR